MMMVRKSLADLRDEMRAVARGERKPAPRPATTLLSALTGDALKLLNVIATTPSTTVSGLAQRLGKAQSNVSRSLQRLAAYGIVRLVREGREVRPELVASAAPSARMRNEVHSDHERLDERSLALHTLVARKLLADPALITHARATLARWRAQTPEPVASYFLEWERILDGAPAEIASFLTSTTEAATRLRQSSPFTGILTPEERSLVFARRADAFGKFWDDWERKHGKLTEPELSRAAKELALPGNQVSYCKSPKP
jgi:predicted transcriptional regulator